MLEGVWWCSSVFEHDTKQQQKRQSMKAFALALTTAGTTLATPQSACTSTYPLIVPDSSSQSGDCIHTSCNLTTAFDKASKDNTLGSLLCLELAPGIYAPESPMPNGTDPFFGWTLPMLPALTGLKISPASTTSLEATSDGSVILTSNGPKLGYIFTQIGGHVRYDSLIFKDAHTLQADDGSAINMVNGTLDVVDCQFLNCVSGEMGGSICIEGIGNSTIRNTRFIGGGGRYGGALALYSPTTVEQCTFENIGSQLNGGAIYSGISLIVKDSTFNGLNSE